MSEADITETDPMVELTAMTEIAKAMQPLDSEAIKRVLTWAIARFSAQSSVAPSSLEAENDTSNTKIQSNSNLDEYADISDLFSSVSMQNDPEKALIVAYWFQKFKGQSDFDAATINSELKHLGHGIANITSALNSLISRKPNLVIQTRKSGSSQQARKKYKLTNEGVKYIERIIREKE